MTGGRDPLDDLLVLARRGGLSEGEQRRLREAVETSTETRLLYEAGRAFDLEAPVVAGDDERIERMVRQVQKRHLRSSTTQRWWRLGQAMAAGALLAAAAIGAVEASRSIWSRNPLESAPDRAAARSDVRVVPGQLAPSSMGSVSSVATSATPREAPSAEYAGEEPSPEERPAPSGVPRAPQSKTPGATASAAPASREPNSGTARFDEPASGATETVVTTSTAAGLFSAANQARMRGDVTGAVALYEQLESEFPRSTEARTARLTVGMLYLQQGDAARALEAFRRFRGLGGGAVPEGLWGEAQALRALGRNTDERAVLVELLREFPGSAYSTAAERRLTELD